MFSLKKYLSFEWLKNKNIIGLFLSLLIFMFPLHFKFAPILISILLVCATARLFISKQRVHISRAHVFLFLFYIFLIIGLYWTENIKTGIFDLEVKASLIIFPILFSLIKYNKNEFPRLIRALVYGVLTFFVIGVFFASKTYIQRGDGLHYFLYARLSPVIHPSYMSMYITTAIAYILHYLKSGLYLFINKTLTVSIVAVLFLINFMLLSKIGIFVSVLILFYYITSWVRREKKYVIGLSSGLIFCLFFIFTYKKVEYVAQRVDEFGSIFDKQSGDSDKSSGVRIQIWNQAINLIKSNPVIGYGTGDVKDVLVAKYMENELHYAVKQKYNAHNQFFQITISSGIIGLSLFLLGVYFGSKNNRLFLIFISISFFYMSVESILENQAGTIFFGLFFSLLSQKYFQEE